jgi:hypothetical protein
MEADPISISAQATTSMPAPPGIDIFGVLWGLFGSSEGAASFFSIGGFLHLLNILWSVYAFFAFILSIAMLALYAYASSRRWQYYALGDKELRDAEALYDEMYRGVRKSDRLSDMLTHIESPHPNDWKLAIIEADVILDDILKQQGYVGNSLGERLKSISPNQLNSLNDAWEAHKVRNRIAHEGADFVLTKRVAEETVTRYRKVFSEFGVR